ncbi:MAG: T9SS type A sorting domain-containing protein [Bacteroidota bacterium]
MKNKVFFILFAIQFSICCNIFGQNNWNWVGQNNDEKVIYFGVKVLNNKIYTVSSTINWSESIPYVNSNLIHFNYQGNIIYDSICGNLNQTFVPYTNVKTNYNLNSFCIPVVFRHPNNPILGEKPGILLLDTLFNTKLSLIIPSDSNINVSSISYFNKFGPNKLILLKRVNAVNSGNVSVLSILDTLGFEQESKVINFQNYSMGSSTFHQHENYYFMISNKIFQNNINDPSNLVIYKLDLLLNIVDSFRTTTNNWYYSNSSAVFPNGDFVVGGVYSDAWEPDGDVWQKKYLRKFDKNLNVIWTKYFGKRSLNTGITKLMITSDGNIAGCGIDGLVTTIENGDSIGHITGCIFKFTADGDSIWMKNYQAIDDPVNGDNNELLDLDEMPDGGFVACGKAVAFSPYRQRGWLMRVDANGCLTPECLNSTKEVDEPSQFLTYPNPTNDILNITNPLQISTYQIYQWDGKLITQGNNFPIDISKFTNGIYFLKITTKNNQIINQKIIKN